MKVDITKLPKSEIELNIEVPVGQWHEFLDETARELSKDLKIEGFRPGHAPVKMVEEKIGMAEILEHAAEHCVRECYVKAILDNDIEAVGQPEISVTKIAKDDPFEFKVKVAVMSEVILPDYKKIAADFKKEKKPIEVSDEEIKKSLEWLQKSRAKHITVNRPAQEGDRVEIDFAGSCDGQNLPELASKNHPVVLGKGYFVPGFEENILGMKEGEEKEFKITFPPDFEHERLAGKEVNFKTKMNLVQEAELPEITDEFAMGLGNFKDLEALKKNIKEGLLTEKTEQEKERWRTSLIEKIAQAARMEIPGIMLENETHRLLDDLKSKVAQAGLEFGQYLEKFKKTENDLHEELGAKAKERLAAFLTLRQIAKNEKIEVPDDELAEAMNKSLKHFKTIGQAEQKIDTEQLKAYTKDVLKNEKVFKILENN